MVEVERLISEEALSSGFNLSSKEVQSIAGLFFRHIVGHMIKGNTIVLEHFGDLVMTGTEKRKREAALYKQYLKNIEHKRLRNRVKCYNFNLRKRYKAHCQKQIDAGLQTWTFDEWRRVFKAYKMKKDGKRAVRTHVKRK